MTGFISSEKLKELCCIADELVSHGSTVAFSNDGDYAVFPGFCDVHVHFREPGFSYKETIKTGSLAAAAGGYTAVCTMPNLNPVPDSEENIKVQLGIIEKDALIHIYPYASITKGEKGEELSDMDALGNYCIAFSDDGRGLQSEALMEKAMLKAKSLNKMIVAHCEVNSLLNGGYIHDGEYAKLYSHKGICSASEYEQIKRDIELVRRTGCAYHVCHISCKESVELIRNAKKEGLNISCETAPHYLVMDDSFLRDEGRFKMNPPLRDKSDREALIEGIKDGTIEIIATDHAPHSAEEKSKGLAGSLFGITGLETAFSVLYTDLVKENIISLEKLVELLSINPKKRFGIQNDGYCIWNLKKQHTVDPEKFLSLGKSTPFAGKKVFGECIMTVTDGKTIYYKYGGKTNG